MLIEIPMVDRVVRLAFLLGISSYSFGITYLHTSKNYFYILWMFSTVQYIYSLFFAELSIKYMERLLDSVVHGLIMGYYAALFNFVFILGFLVYCDAKEFIDKSHIIQVPLMNMKIVTLHYMNNKYNLSFDSSYCYDDIINSLKTKVGSIKEYIKNQFLLKEE